MKLTWRETLAIIAFALSIAVTVTMVLVNSQVLKHMASQQETIDMLVLENTEYSLVIQEIVTEVTHLNESYDHVQSTSDATLLLAEVIKDVLGIEDEE